MSELERLQEENKALKKERDDLLMYNQRLIDAGHYMTDDWENVPELADRVPPMIRALRDPRAGCLVRRDARMKAEALEEVSMLYPSEVCAEFDSIRADLQGAAYHYRKQVEED